MRFRAAALLLTLSACSPVYVFKAGLAEVGILGDRRPLAEVVLDPGTDPRTRDVLTLVAEARDFAASELGLEPGGAYTSYSQLSSDTLVLVLSAARRDALVPRTWWFPVVGRVPYRGFFDEEDARRAQRRLEEGGFDTYLRPSAAFSTLGWFDDPLLSSLLAADDVEVVTTVFHELSHSRLFVPGRVGFNESFATFVGRAAAVEFFCTRPGGGPETRRCRRAEARWRDVRRFSVFLEEFLVELDAVYENPALTQAEKVALREPVFRRAVERFRLDVQPGLESLSFGSFTDPPPNNATLLSRVRYYRRLVDFGRLLEARGSVREAVAFLSDRIASGQDPFALLPPAALPSDAAGV